MVVVTVVVGMLFMGVGGVPMRVVMMLDGVAARTARMRANERDDRGDDGPEQRQEDDCLDHSRVQPFIRLTSSTAIEPRLRKYTTRIARPIAVSAAATVSTSSANTWPTMSPRKVENATRLTLTASRISSIDINITMMFLRLRKMPRIPSGNRIAPTER